MLTHYVLCAQSARYAISGYVEDVRTGEKLISANVYEGSQLQGTVTNNYGFFSLTLTKDTLNLVVSYIGYKTNSLRIPLFKDTLMNIRLEPELELATVEVVAEKIERFEQNTQMGRIEVPIEQIEKIPSIFGEVDILKALQLLPGVQAGGEAQNGLYVRGGSPDQNLILLDGVPVYNVSHLMGFFSVFNTDAVKHVSLTKGGFPARYGGRLSSVIEINMKDGNMNELHGEGSVGLIASRLTLEGPIQKGKTSFMVSGRRTYADYLVKPIIKASTEAENDSHLKLYFFDLNAKINHKFNDRHRLFWSIYSGSDAFGARFRENFENGYFQTEGGIDWGNITSAARCNFMINNRLFSNTTLTFSRFRFNFLADFEEKENAETTSFSAKYFSGIKDLTLKSDFDFIPSPEHYLRLGAGLTRHTYDPGAFVVKAKFEEEKLDTTLGSLRTNSLEFSMYCEDDFSKGAFKFNLGMHLSGFLVDRKFYPSAQPRLGVRYLLINDWALKASFSTMTQYINLLTNESHSLPTDLWVPSTRRIKPQSSWQSSLGVANTIWNEYELSIEGYYKKMHNVLSYKEGISFLGLENDWQDKVTQGSGQSYGAEFFLQKKRGKTTGWLGYTLSWTWRQFDEINSGKKYPFKYDRRQDVEIVLAHKFSKRITGSVTWVYGTGNAITLPLARYGTPVYYSNENDGYYIKELQSLGDKNAFRMRAYHRLDVSLEFRKKLRKHERTWVIGAFNAYNRPNPYYVYDGRDENGNRAFRQISLFPVIPSVAYNFKF
jgi:hypothetical protein